MQLWSRCESNAPIILARDNRQPWNIQPHIWVGVVNSISLRLTQSAIYHAIETKDFRKSITTVAIFIQSPTIALSVDETIFNCLKLIRLLLYIALEYS